MRGRIIMITFIISVILLMLGCTNPALQYLEQGDTYTDQEQWNEAIGEYSKAIELDPNLAEAYVNRAMAYTFLGMDDQAQADIEQAITLGISRVLIETRVEQAKQMR